MEGRRDRSYRATRKEGGAGVGDTEHACDPRQCVVGVPAREGENAARTR